MAESSLYITIIVLIIVWSSIPFQDDDAEWKHDGK